MKPGSNSKRSRGRGNPRRPNGGHGGHGGPRTQVFESNGPEVRIRGTVNQVLEKYLALARDASSSGDYVSAENFFQHAEHYYRILSANGGVHGGLQRFPTGQGQPQPQQTPPQQQNRSPGDQRRPEGAPDNGASAQPPAGGNGSGAAPAAAADEGGFDASDTAPAAS